MFYFLKNIEKNFKTKNILLTPKLQVYYGRRTSRSREYYSTYIYLILTH
jgi:hypothetical protein